MVGPTSGSILPRRAVVAGLAIALAVGSLSLAGCVHPPRREPPVPPRLEVQAPAYLSLAVVGMTKRPLARGELTPPERAGFHWEYQVVFRNAGAIGLRLEVLRMTVRSLSGITGDRVQSLPSRVEPGGSTPISVQAFLLTSDLGEPRDLVGTHELTFLGTDDRGQPVQVLVRVPLE